MDERDIFINPPLVDAVAMSVYNENFQVPYSFSVAALTTENFVKVCAGGERFWCKIVDVEMDGSYIGRIDNDLINTAGHGMKCGDLIKIQQYQIYQVQ